MDKNVISLDINEIYPLFISSYEIPIEYRGLVRDAINRYSQPKSNKYSKDKLNEMVSRSISPLDTFKYLTDKKNLNYSQWKGHLAEWIVCYEYNSFRNNENILFTFVNPDSTSKADILHIIKVGNGYKCIAGPDIKTGNVDYLLNQLEKVWKHEGNIPFYDYYGMLKDEKKLTTKQKERLSNLKEMYPRKKILTPSISKLDVIRVSDKFLRMVAEQQRGPTSSAVKKAKVKAITISRKRRSWTDFNYNTYEKEKIAKRIQEELKALKEEENSRLEEEYIKNKSEEENKRKKEEKIFYKIKKRFSSFVRQIENTEIGRYIKEHRQEIIVNAALTTLNAVFNERSSLRGKKVPKDKQNVTPNNNIQNAPVVDKFSKENKLNIQNEPLIRKSPIEHGVRGYFKKNGNYVRPYNRGKNK